MKCATFREQVAVFMYGRLTDNGKAAWEMHGQRCSRCAPLYRRVLPLQALPEERREMPIPDWEASWEAIAGRLSKKSEESKRHPLPRRLAWAAGLMAVVFCLGYFLGKRSFHPASTPHPEVSLLGGSLVRPWESYANGLEILLASFSNQADPWGVTQLSPSERQETIGLLTRTRVLKGLALEKDDASLRELLQEVENILVDVAHWSGEDPESFRLLREAIREHHLTLRLRRLIQPSSSIKEVI